MKTPGFALFETPVGPCGIAWDGAAVTAVLLPSERESATLARLKRQFPEAREGTPTPAVRNAIERIVALLRGDASDLSPIPLNMDGVPPFHRRVYELARTIPPGATLSYG